MSVLVVVECAEGEVKKSSLEVASYGAQVATMLGTTATAIAVGEANEASRALRKYCTMRSRASKIL